MADIFSGKRTIPETKQLKGPIDYFYLARASRNSSKASIDLLFEDEE